MSSHKEAPGIKNDPVADSTDLYAFVSPDSPSTVTIVANYIPLEEPAGGPNFDQFGDDVMYEIHIAPAGPGNQEISYQFRFTTTIQNPNTFLYNTGPIKSLTDPNWNVRQSYSVTKVQNRQAMQLGSNIPTPPSRIGPRSTPNYEALAAAAITTLPGGEVVFAGQRADPFFVDLGSIFDLGTLRPFQNAHLIPTPASAGVNALKAFNVHSIVLQVPITSITATGAKPTGVADANASIGFYTTASRQASRVLSPGAAPNSQGPWVQVSRLGNPLVNEVIIPLAAKDLFNQAPPTADSQFVQYFNQPGLAKLLPVLYPGVFPNLANLKDDRSDIVAILLTGLPAGVVPGFQNATGTTMADMLRLNVAVPPSASPSRYGLLGGDAGGYPNGRRLENDVISIELQALAGATYPLVNKAYSADAAATAVNQGVSPSPNSPYLSRFPYVGTPYEGYSHQHD
ncbi:MAG: DUF4331 domain-containing protein [Chloroflexota bacterium]|nr:DUF4331 domain-containing protein [Chloroflexota bacterium]